MKGRLLHPFEYEPFQRRQIDECIRIAHEQGWTAYSEEHDGKITLHVVAEGLTRRPAQFTTVYGFLQHYAYLGIILEWKMQGKDYGTSRSGEKEQS